jgi:phage gp29-like protein
MPEFDDKPKKRSPLAIFNRFKAAAASAIQTVTLGLQIRAANRWRDQFNPLRGLNIAGAIHYLEEGEQGKYVGLQWLYRFIEMQDATLGAVIDRRESAIKKLDWDIRRNSSYIEEPAEKRLVRRQREIEEKERALYGDLGFRQEQALRELFNGIKNFKSAWAHLSQASFRGFSHLEKVYDETGRLTELRHIPQWHWVREGLNGRWEIVPEFKRSTYKGEPLTDEQFERLLIREVERPINRVALVCYVRKNMSQKDWDGFVESYGIPPLFVFGPPDIPDDLKDEYQDAAEAVASDTRGYLPHGSDVKTVDAGERGTNPFQEHIDYQDAQVVLRGTGGKLTMLTESGSGTLAGNAHADTFDAIAEAEAMEISELIDSDIARPYLEAMFPGKPILRKFEICAGEETDPSQVIKDAAAVKKAGYKMTKEELEEKSGYELVDETESGTGVPPVNPDDPKKEQATEAPEEGDTEQSGATDTTGGTPVPQEEEPVKNRDTRPADPDIRAILELLTESTSDQETADLLQMLADTAGSARDADAIAAQLTAAALAGYIDGTHNPAVSA